LISRQWIEKSLSPGGDELVDVTAG